MRELADQLTALNPDAGAAIKVIEYFDALVEGHAGVEAFVRGAAVLSGCPAGVLDPRRHLEVRICADGRHEPGAPRGMVTALQSDGDALVWLERGSSDGAVVDAVVLERLATGLRVVLDRTRVALPTVDPASVETLIDPTVDNDTRRLAAARLGLKSDGVFRVVVSPGADQPRRDLTVRFGGLDVTVEPAESQVSRMPRRAASAIGRSLEQIPPAHELARLALRFTAAGTLDDPGQMRVAAADLGGLLTLAPGCDTPAAAAEVAIIESVAVVHEWALVVFDALASCASLRTAALALHVHHSTLQDRVSVLDRMLPYNVQSSTGRTRLAIALALRRLRRNRW